MVQAVNSQGGINFPTTDDDEFFNLRSGRYIPTQNQY
jgi:hypothetical protein